MWTELTVEDRAHPTCLCHHDGRLFWLIEDEDAQPVEDTFGRMVARKKLISYDIPSAERRTMASALPPSQTLAVGPDGAFVWGLLRESVLRITDDGVVEQFTCTEEQPDGGLQCVGERLFFVGKLNPATTGVAVYEPQSDHFRRVLETGDPTPSTLDRVHVDQDRVYYLTHDPRGWILQSISLAGDEDEQFVTRESRLFRRIAKAERGFVLGDDHALYLFDDERLENDPLGSGPLDELAACEVPPDDITPEGRRTFWTTSAVENEDAELVDPWRVYAVDDAPDASVEVIFESGDRIAGITAGSWGVACLLRQAKIGVVAEIGTSASGAVVIVSPR